jgi:serine/threonine protein kinase
MMRDPNIVRYINVEEAEDEPDMIAISMEYVPGGSITYLLQFFKSFKEPLVKIYINQVVKALWRLHQNGITHRDIKTTNLMVDDLGTVKLSDFGFIKDVYSEYCPKNVYNVDELLFSNIRKKSKVNSIQGSNLTKLITNYKEPLKPLVNSFFYTPPEVHNKQATELKPSFDIWSLG